MKLNLRFYQLFMTIYRFSTKSDEGNVTLDECRELFQKIQTEYFEEYRLFRLEEIAIASVLPLVIFDYLNQSSSRLTNI